MPAWHLNFGIFSLVAVIMLVMASVSFGYLLRIKDRSKASQLLLWFFLCVILSAISTLLTNLGMAWSWAFAPSQDAFLILGGVFLVRFAYAFPDQDNSAETRWIIRVFEGFALLAVGYSLYFAYLYLSSLPVELEEVRAYYLITPIVIFGMVLIFFMRSFAISMQEMESLDAGQARWRGILPALFSPRNVAALGLRNFGLALSLGLIPVIVFLIKPALPVIVASFFFNFGIVLSVGAIMLVYFNHAPEPTTIMAKLVGISLVTILVLLGLTCTLILHLSFDVNEHRIVSLFMALVLTSSLFLLIVFPIFFRTTIFVPLARLLEGIHAANDGRLETVVEPSFNDEIGYLTRSFNQMVSSLKAVTSSMENWGLDLEREVSQRTIDLVNINVRLEKEVENREIAEARLNQQLQYQQALAGCSQSLLVAAEGEKKQQEVLTQALEHLRSGAQVSRAYVINIFDDSEMELCMAILAEACASEIPAHINNPNNQKIPLSSFPTDFANALFAGNPFGGSVKEIFSSTPTMQDAFLTQKPPLLSLTVFPLFHRNRLWGFIGFDDCTTEREWDVQAISMLRTASEMIGNTMQRWEIETQLRETLDELEVRVQERTAELSQSNIKLNEEIQQRQLVQNDLETRLQIEEILASISTLLLEPTKIRENIATSLEDLAGIMNAGRIFLVEFDLGATNLVRDYIEWYGPELQPMSEEVVQGFMDSMIGLRERLLSDETIYIPDTAQASNNFKFDMHSLQERNVHSLVLLPITYDQRMHGVLGCSNLPSSADSVQMNLSALELVASMLKSLLQRENLIQYLEEQVAERTHQLTTFLDMAMINNQAQDLADILQPTLLSIIQIATCDAAAIHIFNEEKSSLELIAQRGIPMEFSHPLREIGTDAEFALWLEETEPYEVLGDPGSDDHILPKPFYFPGFGTFFANRLSTGGKSLGLLSCYRVAEKEFSPFQATLLTALGDLLGIVVENHRLKVEAQELATVEERQRLAREIHDAVSQSVYSLSLFARSATDALAEKNQSKVLSNLQDIEATALQAMREMRLLLYQLREAGQGADIETTLNDRFKQVENRLGIQATYEIGADIILPAHIQHEIWRILIEALNNVVKHASASHVYVKISCLDDYLLVFVKDDGIGFEMGNLSPGMGLENIQARADTLGGHLEIVSASGQGTQISLKVPMACIEEEGG